MQRITRYFFAAAFLLAGCKHKTPQPVATDDPAPVVTNNGQQITFPDSASTSFFSVESVGDSVLSGTLHAPGKVAATVVRGDEGGQNIVLFDDPGLNSDYSQLIQHKININHIQQINITQRKIELDRTQDLYDHGAASGKDILEAKSNLSMEQTNLANEKTQLIEHESGLKAAGFDPEALRSTSPGSAYIICDIPENQLNNVKRGAPCTVVLSSFPNNTYDAKVEDIADVIDDVTRMIKLRIRLNTPDTDIRAGMFATVTFQVHGDNKGININRDALVTSEGQNYVFVRTAPNTFTRREIRTGQQIGERIAVYSGLQNGESVVLKGVMQLKGLSFGY
ncbi:efflux RND transporter periplasmic adaptor subunit [Chitinophaga pinensis]|uniref:Efflux transporter, RND family, MFP subunit n=1 Tax=Chitinophaga pinensis (strain ATCC 43595 / DSM 2588 / LMG 13176 / NBRC 15968 / NCIMB 11800 / UQM 2034) TaxID=485918 RepID=A0A979GC51_CHIPD|nr:efflux RND transporter periplasmic adaptor subunit [Chitinophaga pinensis]ACU64602.1 efflux transporter, RND family, MFP subunit [Chitinophaga pinensis DSM 2588]